MNPDHEPDYRDETCGFIRAAVFLIIVISMLGIVAQCSAHGAECKIAWDAQEADSFRVWRGIELLGETKVNEATVMLPDDQASSITVTAINDHGESAHSAPLELVTVRVHESSNLRTWWIVRTVHREKRAAMFYRLEIQP